MTVYRRADALSVGDLISSAAIRAGLKTDVAVVEYVGPIREPIDFQAQATYDAAGITPVEVGLDNGSRIVVPPERPIDLIWSAH